MQRRIFSGEFKLEAVKLMRDRGVGVAQAARDLDVAESVLRRWMRDAEADPQQAFPGKGQVKPDHQEVNALRLKAERDILKKRRPALRGSRYEVRLHCKASRDLAGAVAL